MLYTKKGDDGTTKLFSCTQGARISKSDLVFEALGTLDELNSSLGYAKVLSKKTNGMPQKCVNDVCYVEILETIQQHLFCFQAELGGSHIRINQSHIEYLENVIDEIEKILPPINTFKIYGGGETGAFLDITRTIARRAERQLVSLQKKKGISNVGMVYMNRLSSTLYALARFANYLEGHPEKKPHYQ